LPRKFYFRIPLVWGEITLVGIAFSIETRGFAAV